MAGLIGQNVIEKAAVGRSFQLGMLYDCRSERLLPCDTLWNSSTIKMATSNMNKEEITEHTTISSNKFGEVPNILGLDENSKLSIIVGLLDTKGSTNFLKEHTLSHDHERVLLHYKYEGKLVSLSIDQLDKCNIQDKHILNSGDATHVVTGILYGGQALLVFDKTHRGGSMKETEEISLQQHIKKIPFMDTCDGFMAAENKKEFDKISVKVYCDIAVPEEPKSYVEAVHFWKMLPKYFRETVIPVKVWLFPLGNLEEKCFQQMPEIKTYCIHNIEKCFDMFNMCDSVCQSMLNTVACQKLPVLARSIREFKELVEIHKLDFQKKLGQNIRKHRGGESTHADIMATLNTQSESPFNIVDLEAWVGQKQNEIDDLQQFLPLTSKSICFTNSPEEVFGISSLVYCFIVKWPATDWEIESMKEYLDKGLGNSRNGCNKAGKNGHEKARQNMRKMAQAFVKMHSDKAGYFVISEDLTDKDTPEFFFYSYQDGSCFDETFEQSKKDTQHLSPKRMHKQRSENLLEEKSGTKEDKIVNQYSTRMPFSDKSSSQSFQSEAVEFHLEEKIKAEDSDCMCFASMPGEESVESTTSFKNTGATAKHHILPSNTIVPKTRENHITKQELFSRDKTQSMMTIGHSIYGHNSNQCEYCPEPNSDTYQEDEPGRYNKSKHLVKGVPDTDTAHTIFRTLELGKPTVRKRCQDSLLQQLSKERFQASGFLTFSDVTHNSMTLTINNSTGSNYQTYNVIYKDDVGPLWRLENCAENVHIPKLEPGTLYKFNVSVNTQKGSYPYGQASCTTLPTSPPGKPDLQMISPFSAIVAWRQPTVIKPGMLVTSYDIFSLTKYTGQWILEKNISGDQTSAEVDIKKNVVYRFKVVANCSKLGKSADSPESDEFCNRADHERSMKAMFKASSTLLVEGSPSVYEIYVKKVFHDKEHNIKKCELGQAGCTSVPEKVVMIVGATGSGKTTLINGMINFVLGVEWKDKYRFKLINEISEGNQAKSQTTSITSYTIHHQDDFNIPFTLTIIDTPGFGDTAGISRDKEITAQIKSFFTTAGNAGIDHLDAIGFVAQASLPRLTPTQQYIFDSILALFGRDIAGNIFMLLTFADGEKPPVLAGLAEAQVAYEKYFKFNNSALFARNVNSTDYSNVCSFDSMFWKMGYKSFKNFLYHLCKVVPKSLVLTQNVLNEREQLETFIQGVQAGIQLGLNKREQLQAELQLLKAHQMDIDISKDFEYTVEEEDVSLEPIEEGTFTTNCIVCKRTCHYPCKLGDDMKQNCASMAKGKCTVCPGKCHWDMHKNLPHIYVIKRERVRKTARELKERYEKAKGKKLSAEQIIKEMMTEIEAIENDIIQDAKNVTECLKRLNEIALRPINISTVEYIDILIQSQESERKPGWNERVNQLKEVRKKAEVMAVQSKVQIKLNEKYKKSTVKLPIKEK